MKTYKMNTHKTICLYSRGGCAVNCATVIRFNHQEVIIRDRYGNNVKINKESWKKWESFVRVQSIIPQEILNHIRLSSSEKSQLINYIKRNVFA